MPFGREVGLGPDDIVLNGEPGPVPQKAGHSTPTILANVLWPNGCIDKDAILVRVGLGPGHCVRWGPSSPSPRSTVPQFSAHVYCGQMVAHVSYY